MRSAFIFFKLFFTEGSGIKVEGHSIFEDTHTSTRTHTHTQTHTHSFIFYAGLQAQQAANGSHTTSLMLTAQNLHLTP